jgi:hypothetical protein
MAAVVLAGVNAAAIPQGAELCCWPFALLAVSCAALAAWAVVALARRRGARGVVGHAIAGMIINILATLFCGLCFLVFSMVPAVRAEIARQQAADGGRQPGSNQYGRSPSSPRAAVETELERRERARYQETKRRLETLRRKPVPTPGRELVRTESLEVETLELDQPLEVTEPLITDQTEEEGARITTLKLAAQFGAFGRCAWSADGERLFFLATGGTNRGGHSRSTRPASSLSSNPAARERERTVAPTRVPHSDLLDISLPDWTVRRRLLVPSTSLAVNNEGLLLLSEDRLLVLDPETWQLKQELYVGGEQLSAWPGSPLALILSHRTIRLLRFGPRDMTCVFADDTHSWIRAAALAPNESRVAFIDDELQLVCRSVEATIPAIKDDGSALKGYAFDRQLAISRDSKFVVVPGRLNQQSRYGIEFGFFLFDLSNLATQPITVRLAEAETRATVEPGGSSRSIRRRHPAPSYPSNTAAVDPVTGQIYAYDSRNTLLVFGADGRFQNAYVPHTDHISPEILVHPEGRKVLIVDASVSLWVELNPSSENPQYDG